MKNINDYINEALIVEAGNRDVEEAVSAWKDFAVLTHNVNGYENNEALKYIAKNNKIEVISLYCDKMEEGDINGIPISHKGNVRTIIPEWAQNILDNKDKKYIVLFIGISESKDANKLYNEIMPIVINHKINDKKCDNFIIGIVDKKLNLPKPLESKLRPVIKA